MARHNRFSPEQAAQAASDAARVLQARQQASQQDRQQESRQDIKESSHTELATHTETEKPGEQRRVIARNPGREMAMEQIRATRGEPSDDAPPPTELPDPVATDAAKPDTKQDAEPVAEAPATPTLEAPPSEAPKMVRVKVDGEEFEVPQADVDAEGGITAYQKGRAAENRLKKANEALAESRRLAAWIAEQQRIQAQPPAKPPELRKQELIDTIRFGSPEESARAMDEYQSLTNPRTDPNQIVQAAVSESQRLQAINQFVTEFQDLNANPLLSKLVVTLVNEKMPQVRQQGGFVDWGTFYRSIGNEVRSAFGRSSQAAPSEKSVATTTAVPTGHTSQVSDKEAKKATIVNLPTASARATVEEESKPETREEALNRMRKARGIKTG